MAFHITPSDTQGLNSYLNELYNIDTDKYERTVGDLTFAHNVARDYFNDSLICGWPVESRIRIRYKRLYEVESCFKKVYSDSERCDRARAARF